MGAITKPRWADDPEPETSNGLSSKLVDDIDHAGKMFKHSTICNGQSIVGHRSGVATAIEPLRRLRKSTGE